MIVLRHFADFEQWEAKVEDGMPHVPEGIKTIALNGEDIHLANSLDDIKARFGTEDEALLDALFQAGLIKTTDDGKFII